MTIKEFAKSQGITTQAVYQKIKAAGIDLASIRKENTAELTAEGLEVCKRLYSKADETIKKENMVLKERLEALEKERNALQIALDSKEQEIEQKEQEIKRITAERDRWASMAEAAQETAQRAQALQMASIQALKRPPRLSLWQRLTGKRAEVLETTAAAAEEHKTE